MGKIATLGFDGFSGLFDLGKAEQQPEIDEEAASKKTRGNWGFDYNLLAGRAQHVLRLLEQIRRKHGTRIITTAHLAAEKLYVERVSKGGEVQQEGRQVAWKVDLPGQTQEQILRPFEEVWHLQIRPNAAGKPPQRMLFTEPHLWAGGAGASANMEGFPFEAKTCNGIKGPLVNPKWDDVVKALPDKGVMPDKILLVGIAGAGKTTFIASCPKPVHFIDLWGNSARACREQEGVTRSEPLDMEDVYRVLMQIRDKGEVN